VKKPVLAALAASAALLVGAAPAAAGDTRCSGGNPFAGGTSVTGTFDNVVVPEGATCYLAGATVRGNVKALDDSNFFSDASTIRGNVEGDKADVVQVFRGSTVGGNIQHKESDGVGELASILRETFVCGVRVGGNVQVEKVTGQISVGPVDDFAVFCPTAENDVAGNVKVEENLLVPAPGTPSASGETLDIRQNFVRGDMQVFKNRGPGTKRVQENTVRQNLQCTENDPPFIGGPNSAGEAEGQCF